MDVVELLDSKRFIRRKLDEPRLKLTTIQRYKLPSVLFRKDDYLFEPRSSFFPEVCSDGVWKKKCSVPIAIVAHVVSLVSRPTISFRSIPLCLGV